MQYIAVHTTQLAKRWARMPPPKSNPDVLLANANACAAAAWAAAACVACAASLDLFLEGVDSLLPLKMFEREVAADTTGREVVVKEANEEGVT